MTLSISYGWVITGRPTVGRDFEMRVLSSGGLVVIMITGKV